MIVENLKFSYGEEVVFFKRFLTSLIIGTFPMSAILLYQYSVPILISVGESTTGFTVSHCMHVCSLIPDSKI